MTSSETQHDWPFYGHDQGGMRYVDIDHINRSNVSHLEPAWVFHTAVTNQKASFESQPIVVNGTLYVTSPHDHVFALDAATGAIKWTYNPAGMPPISEMAICCAQVNRGVAYGDGKVFIARLDCELVALDAETGQVVWQKTIADYHQNFTETMAPQFAGNLVLVGISGGEFMVRGFVTAYDARSGEEVWKFYTIPSPGEPGNDTWSGDSWKTGGATVWSTPEVDPDLGLVYIHTGNAAPDLYGKDRAGDNLYTVSLVAVDLKTGTYRWHFQEVHHDLWDYDAVQPAHLFDLHLNGQTIPAIGHANKNGYYFILDRRTGKPIEQVNPVKEAPVPQQPAWQHPSPTQPESAVALIPRAIEPGTPVPAGQKAAPMWTPPHEQPILIQPGYESGPEWGAGAYSPRTKYAYIPAGGYEPWSVVAVEQLYTSIGGTGTQANQQGMNTYGLFCAVDTTSGKIVWHHRTDNKTITGTVVVGDLVFWGESDGTFICQDAENGQVLWRWKNPDGWPNVGGANGSPAAYVVDGQAYIVMAFGGNLRARQASPHPTSPVGDALIAFALPHGSRSQPRVVHASPVPVPLTPLPRQPIPVIASPPSHAHLIEMHARYLHYFPDHFEVSAGEEVVVHLKNDDIAPIGFIITLQDQILETEHHIHPGEDVYLLFNAPQQTGEYHFHDVSPMATYARMTGTMRVGSSGGSSGRG